MQTSVDPARLPGIELLRAAAAGEAPSPPVAALLGWEALDIEPGFVRVRYQASEEFYNPHGTVQGGLITAMLDDAMGPAGLTTLDAGQFAPTLEIKVSFARPALAGPLVAEGRVVHKTNRFLFLEGRLFSEAGDLLATATATAVITKGGPPAQST